jgi:hypothetical protein
VGRRILAVAVLAALALASAAWAAPNGKYSGKSKLTISGSTVTHPFSLTVKHGKVTEVSLIAGSSCADLDGAAGLDAHFKINKHNRFSGTLKWARFTLKFKGTFKLKHVTGSFTGTAKGLTATCPVPTNTFMATLP